MCLKPCGCKAHAGSLLAAPWGPGQNGHMCGKGPGLLALSPLSPRAGFPDSQPDTPWRAGKLLHIPKLLGSESREAASRQQEKWPESLCPAFCRPSCLLLPLSCLAGQQPLPATITPSSCVAGPARGSGPGQLNKRFPRLPVLPGWWK